MIYLLSMRGEIFKAEEIDRTSMAYITLAQQDFSQRQNKRRILVPVAARVDQLSQFSSNRLLNNGNIKWFRENVKSHYPGGGTGLAICLLTRFPGDRSPQAEFSRNDFINNFMARNQDYYLYTDLDHCYFLLTLMVEHGFGGKLPLRENTEVVNLLGRNDVHGFDVDSCFPFLESAIAFQGSALLKGFDNRDRFYNDGLVNRLAEIVPQFRYHIQAV